MQVSMKEMVPMTCTTEQKGQQYPHQGYQFDSEKRRSFFSLFLPQLSKEDPNVRGHANCRDDFVAGERGSKDGDKSKGSWVLK